MSELRGPGRGEGGEPAAEQQVELHVGDVGGEHAHQLRHLHRARVTCHVSLGGEIQFVHGVSRW